MDSRLVIAARDGTLTAYESSDGSARWRTLIGDMGRMMVLGSQTYLARDREDGRQELLAFDRKTGEKRWANPTGYQIRAIEATDDTVSVRTHVDDPDGGVLGQIDCFGLSGTRRRQIVIGLPSVDSLGVAGSRVVAVWDRGFEVLARDTGASWWSYEPESASRLSFRVESASVFVSYMDDGETARFPLGWLRVPESPIRRRAPHQLIVVSRGYSVSEGHEPMDDIRHASPLECLVEAAEIRTDDEVNDFLGELLTVSPEDRKRAFRELRDLANDRPTAFESFMPAVTPFLTDDERVVRLLTAKAFVVVAEADSDAVAPAVSALAERLADENGFYYIRAWSAEALGYVALDHPDAVASSVVLTDLRVGLSFDKPEAKQKLAKALECVALGGPERLRHRVSALAEHLDDGDELVRHHLYTAVAGVGCNSSDSLAAVRGALSARLIDENVFVRGRTAEALGLLTGERGDRRDHGESVAVPDSALGAESNEAATFVAERVRFLRALMEGDTTAAASAVGSVGTLAGVRRTTADAVTKITSSDAEDVCPHCGIDLAEGAPPMCPSCDAPYWTPRPA